MSKEELQDSGWDVIFSGECQIARWGKYMVQVRHALKGSIHGYGDNEQQALNDISEMLQKRAEIKNEISH